MEVGTLRYSETKVSYGKTQLLRVQSDDRLVVLIRKGNQAAFEALVSRYQPRLFAFCRHMLNSKEDAEDVLQEVFASSYNSLLTDDRPVNTRPWLYKIARNRCLNHLRKAQTVGVDSMDIHFADHGLSTAEKADRNEDFNLLVQDVKSLPENQRTALLMREIDALSYDQIAEAMDTSVASIKSLLVRARVSLAETAEARLLTCEEVRIELGEAAEGLIKISPPVKRHIKDCERCMTFKKQLESTNKNLAAIAPLGPLLLFQKFVIAKLGALTASSASVAGSTAATGALSGSLNAIASKAAASFAAAAIVAVGTAEVRHAAVDKVAQSPAPIAQVSENGSNTPLSNQHGGSPTPATPAPESDLKDESKDSEETPQTDLLTEPESLEKEPVTPPVDPATTTAAPEEPAVTTPDASTVTEIAPTTPTTQEDVDTVPLPSSTGGVVAPVVPDQPTTETTPTTVVPQPEPTVPAAPPATTP